MAATLLAGGCAEDEIHFTEVRQPDQPVTAEEWAAFVRIVEAMPEPKLAPIASAAVPLPQWQDARTMPVYELAAEERLALENAWETDQIARRFAGARGLNRLLKREGMTIEQLTGLTLTISAAMRRAKVSDDFPWDELLRRGERTVVALERDQRLFAGLPLDVRHHVLDDAVWLHRVDRAVRLRKVPGDNVKLVKEHADWLAKHMPESFQKSPFEDVVDRVEELGVPFVELPETGHDDELEWNPADAIVGVKPPQP
ncbi:MAG TPA: hypothetical protein VM165_17550 [Planctomycetaceae bacterium]|nr:hypothetical protein [Planctomycetaceae bacterium]